MELFRRILIFYVLKATFVTGEELLLLTSKGKICRYNTKNKQAKIIAENATHMACDFERKFLYYTQLRVIHKFFIKILRVDYDGGDIKTISDSGSAESTTGPISVDQETGNLYYYSGRGIGFYSYTRNYSKTIISTTAFVDYYVYDIGFHGTGSNRSVYWSTQDNLYRSQPGTSELVNLGSDCMLFSILENGIVCFQLLSGEPHLANLDGKKIESLPNITMTTSTLKDIHCSGPDFIEDVTIVGDSLYIVCQTPNQVLKVSLQTGIKTGLISKRIPALQEQSWLYICVLSHVNDVLPNVNIVLSDQRVVSPIQTATIVIVVGGVAVGLVIIVSLIAAIGTCIKEDCMPRNYDNHTVNQRNEPEYSSYNSNSIDDDHVYTTMDSNKSTTEVNTVDDPVYTEIL